jgi:hypothetical protein
MRTKSSYNVAVCLAAYHWKVNAPLGGHMEVLSGVWNGQDRFYELALQGLIQAR